MRKLDPGSTILDVCCGTGQFVRKLRAGGFRVVGVDASYEMLRHAAANAPGCGFLCADIRSFCLSRKFDAAFSLYDSLNHLLTLDDLESAFLNVAELPRSGRRICLRPQYGDHVSDDLVGDDDDRGSGNDHLGHRVV